MRLVTCRFRQSAAAAMLAAAPFSGFAQGTVAPKKTRTVRLTLKEGTNIAAAVSPGRDRGLTRAFPA